MSFGRNALSVRPFEHDSSSKGFACFVERGARRPNHRDAWSQDAEVLFVADPKT